MPTIKQLSTSVVNKIAAGEVIERPASVVKELVENSLDAGATRIEVVLEQGGLETVRVVDNGSGIAADELPLAVASHATSKLETADDLFRVRSLGFRGEALASIAEVSRFTLRSRTADATGGAEIVVSGGTAESVSPCGCAIGTTVEVRNLFFNTPVRRRFLRATQTEMGHVTEAFTRLALAHPQVHFTLRHNERAVYELTPCTDWRARIAHFFGEDMAAGLIWIESEHPPVRLAGYVAHPSQSRTNAKMQYLFLNGRCIRDRSLSHALSEAYRGLLLTGRHPISFLCFDMPPDLIDVNVHPTKLEVRFQDAGRLYSQLLSTIRTKFLSTDLTHVLDPARAASADSDRAPLPSSAPALALVEWAKGELQTRSGSLEAMREAFSDASPSPVGEHALGQPPLLDVYTMDRRWEPAASIDEPDPEDQADSPPIESMSLSDRRPLHASTPIGAPHWQPSRAAHAVQIHNRYLITESAEGVLVIDQHALHERILYEQLRAKIHEGALEAQSLLVPEPVDLNPAEAAAAIEHRDLLAQLGIRVEPFGGGTVLVSSYPAMLAAASPTELLRELVDRLVSGSGKLEARDVLDELLHMMSCKAAVKAGDHLTSEEIAALLEQRHLAQDAHHCPHGRPTSLVFTREELDRQFMRT